jgi:mannose-6-phosphate isomerase
VSGPIPVLLRADNFTPVARTPWGGTRLASRYKADYLGALAQRVVGESWEVSVEPDFPARLEDGRALADYIAAQPEAVLGHEHALGRRGTALLVKLLDAAEPLSVQIHPSDSYARLRADECGKPESWYVVERTEGAGLYLGFQRGVREADVREALDTGASLEPLMRFIAVEPGDFFVIDAGIPHAIGAGLTLVEPQHVLPGRRGVTYRYWDWNRRYDAQGLPSATGTARALHRDDALAVTDWQRFDADDFLERIRLRVAPTALDLPPETTPLAGGAGLENRFLRVSRLAGSGAALLPYPGRLQSITVLEGSLQLGDIHVNRGRSAVVPACLPDTRVELREAHAIVCAVA